jgi:hypothetical protein
MEVICSLETSTADQATRSHDPEETTIHCHRYGQGKGKAIPVTGRGGQYDCEMSRLPYSLDNRLTDGGEIVSLTSRTLFTPRKILVTHLLEAESTLGPH